MYHAKELFKKLATTEGASDLIVTAGSAPTLRVYRTMNPLNLPELTGEDSKKLCYSILDKTQIEEFEKEMELDVAISLENIGRFRVNVFRQKHTVAMVVRIVSEKILSFKELRVPEAIKSFSKLTSGLVLVTGPTGSGKSTTLSAILDDINHTRSCHIVTIEDPIEVIHSPVMATVNQREVGTDTGSYNEALKRVLRQSPDVIMIGEIRDRESAQAAITLAETGHLTFATLHTRGAISAVNRMVDMFPANQTQQLRSQLSASLAGVVWQQLVPTRDNKRLVLACEIMIATPAIKALILNGNTHEIISLIQTGKKYGMCTMDQALEELQYNGVVDLHSCGKELATSSAH